MTDKVEAQKWLQATLNVSRETMDRLEVFADFLGREAQSQNLVSSSTLDVMWDRHIVDSAQLLNFVPKGHEQQSWLDLGSGAGFPGIVIALLSEFRVTLVESRMRRIEYLQRAVALLDIEDRVSIAGMALERFETVPYQVISARAFAPLPRLFDLAARFSTDKTLWLLPKGRNAAKEWNEAQSEWKGDIRIEPSVTDPEAGILVGHLTGMPGIHAAKTAMRLPNK